MKKNFSIALLILTAAFLNNVFFPSGASAARNSVLIAPDIIYGQTVNGTINPANATKSYMFHATAGDNILVAGRRLTGGSFDPSVVLRNSAGAQLASAYLYDAEIIRESGDARIRGRVRN